jgi:hypothetical protein
MRALGCRNQFDYCPERKTYICGCQFACPLAVPGVSSISLMQAVLTTNHKVTKGQAGVEYAKSDLVTGLTHFM